MRKILSHKLFVTPRILASAAVMAVGAGIGLYLWYHLALLFAPPFLVLEKPPRDIITKEHTLVLVGATQKESHVFVNGRDIVVSEKGAFSDALILQEGMNIFEVKSVNKFGKETTLVRRIIKE